MSVPEFQTLLAAYTAVHHAHPGLKAFCPVPDDVTAKPVDPFWIDAAGLMTSETGFGDGHLTELRDAFINAAPVAHWRETYKDTDIGEDFMSRFACYCLIGPNAPYDSQQTYAFVVYMPPNLWYPWHRHPAEEVYLCIAGEAEFLCAGEAPKTLRPGEVSEHASLQPHATRTHDKPFMALVLWRNHFETPPVLCEAPE